MKESITEEIFVYHIPDMPYAAPKYKSSSAVSSRQRAQYNHDQTRLSSYDRGYDHKWRTVRLDYLQRHPLCKQCLSHNLFTPATDVDHIIPAVLRPDLFWEESNYQSLCHACHSSKTARENGFHQQRRQT